MNKCRRRADSNSPAAGAFLIVVAAATTFYTTGVAQEPQRPMGRIVGAVTVQGTGEPVAGARVRVFTDRDEIGVGYKQAEATSDATGRYILELPVGNVMFSSPLLPPGYWTVFEHYRSATTTQKRPEYTKHYVVERGPTWRIALDADDKSAVLLPEVMIVGSRFTAEPHVLVETQLDNSRVGKLTLPEAGGEFQIRFYELSMQLVSHTPATLSVDPGFQPHRVISANRNDKTAEIVFIDAAERRATLAGTEGSIVDGQVEIRFSAPLPSEEKTFDVSGLVLDADGQPLAEAVVTLGSGNERGSAMSHYLARTDKSGRFVISNIAKSLYSGQDQQLFVVATHEEFAGAETDWKPLAANVDKQPFDLGTIRLNRGHQARLRVQDADGQPVLGAWVEPSGYAALAQFARTDADGLCTLCNLATGIQKVDVRFGDAYGSATLVVVPESAEETLVQLRPLPQSTSATTAAAQHNPLAVGEAAPDWEVSGWTDEVARRLSEFRGKVVVIEFWGVWCSACINGIPGMKEVHERFRERDVVFLGIHTAEGDLIQARRLLELKRWDLPTGLDVGDEINRGTTVKRYRVRGFPTTIIVGRDGKVAFNSDAAWNNREAGTKELKRSARELDIPWPLPQDISLEEGIPMMNRIFAHRLSKQIEEALRAE
jgi:thiol-disulfide isomerase/thioredoxin